MANISPDIDRKTWDEFRETGLVWWANRLLHVFGWALVLERSPDGKAIGCFPARVKYRGFPAKVEDEGFFKVSAWLAAHAEEVFGEVAPFDESKPK